MDRAIIPLLAAILLASPAGASVPPLKNNKALFSLWGKLRQPLPGPPEPIGTYVAGCLGGAERLPLDGQGYSVMRPSRLRYFGHPDLLRFIRELGQKRVAGRLSLLLVGDMGRPRGGPMITGHASHQIGLDVDLWFRTTKRRPSLRQRESWNAGSFVTGERALSPAWSAENRRLVAEAAESSLVDRVFVNPVIKRDLCTHFKDSPWLYKVRAWWGHADHFHVRLACPPGSATCQPQAALDPAKSQCDEELDWWFSAEARDEGMKKQASFAEREFPALPENCGRMLEEQGTK